MHRASPTPPRKQQPTGSAATVAALRAAQRSRQQRTVQTALVTVVVAVLMLLMVLRLSSDSHVNEHHLAGGTKALLHDGNRTPSGLLQPAFRRLGHADRIMKQVERDPGIARLLELASHEATSESVVFSVTLADVLHPLHGAAAQHQQLAAAGGAIEALDESVDCGADDETRQATLRFRAYALGRPTFATRLSGRAHTLVGAITRTLLEAVLAQTRAKRYDVAPALGIAGERYLVFGHSGSGDDVPLIVDLTTGELMAGPPGSAVAIARAENPRCWRAIGRRRVSGGRQERVHRLLAPLTLRSVRVAEENALEP